LAIETNTKIGLISRALLLIGEKPAQALDDDRYGVTVGAEMFEMTYENELQSNRWRFAVKKEQLARLVDVPQNQWQYAYQLPSDCLLPLHIYPVAPYEIYGDRVYTNETTVEMDYVFKPEISQLPAYFCALLTYALARDMLKPVTEDKGESIAVMHRKYQQQRDRAMFADAQGRPSTPIQRSPFTDVR
jgi:hypothetical protein